MNLAGRLLWVDDRLAAKGFPRLSPWWRETLTRFFSSSVRRLVVRAGRRGGKSTSLVRALVTLALYGDHKIPPGDLGVVAVVSISKDEANQRLRLIKAILDALAVKYTPIEDGIELEGRPIGFKVYACAIGAVSGFTAIGVLADEVAKWRDKDGANPATDVLASLRPTMATMPSARMFLSSSPFGSEDAHAKAFDEGETDGQQVAYAPTWVANPTITEAQTRADEPDPKVWAREYAAIPQAGSTSVFDLEMIEAAERDFPRGVYSPPVLILDPSSGRGDAWTGAFFSWCKPEPEPWMFAQTEHQDANGKVYLRHVTLDESGRPIVAAEHRHALRPTLCMYDLAAMDGRFADHITFDDVVDCFAKLAHEHNVDVAYGDQREGFPLQSAFKRRGIRYTPLDWTGASKPEQVERVRRLFLDRQIVIPRDEALRRELLNFREKISPSTGALTYGARGTGHDDRVALFLTAALADNEHLLSGSPLRKSGGRTIVHDDARC